MKTAIFVMATIFACVALTLLVLIVIATIFPDNRDSFGMF